MLWWKKLGVANPPEIGFYIIVTHLPPLPPTREDKLRYFQLPSLALGTSINKKLTLQCVNLCSARPEAVGHISSQILHLCLPVVVECCEWPFMWFSRSVRDLQYSLQYAQFKLSLKKKMAIWNNLPKFCLIICVHKPVHVYQLPIFTFAPFFFQSYADSHNFKYSTILVCSGRIHSSNHHGQWWSHCWSVFNFEKQFLKCS